MKLSKRQFVAYALIYNQFESTFIIPTIFNSESISVRKPVDHSVNIISHAIFPLIFKKKKLIF